MGNKNMKKNDSTSLALVSLNKWVDKENVMCVRDGVLLNH